MIDQAVIELDDDKFYFMMELSDYNILSDLLASLNKIF
jgi:hypothetical protein